MTNSIEESKMNWGKTCRIALLILIITILAVTLSFAIANIEIEFENDCIEIRPDLWPTWEGYEH